MSDAALSYYVVVDQDHIPERVFTTWTDDLCNLLESRVVYGFDGTGKLKTWVFINKDKGMTQVENYHGGAVNVGG